MNRAALLVSLALVVVASSYGTLGLAARETARNLWWVYAALSAILAVVNLSIERARRPMPRKPKPTTPEERKVRVLDRVDKLMQVITVILGLVTVALVGIGIWTGVLTSRINDTVSQIQAGRKASSGIVCTVVTAISDAGRTVLTESTPVPAKLEAQLERLGFPPAADRKAAQQASADKYVHTITSAVQAKLGKRADGIVKADGTLDCDALARLAGTAR